MNGICARCGWCADFCRALGRWALMLPKGLGRLADWFEGRGR